MGSRLRVFQREEGQERRGESIVKLYLLESGWVQVAKALIHKEGGFHLIPPATGWFKADEDKVWIPVVAYLIDRDGELVVVDTGFHEICQTDPVKNIGRFMTSIARGFRVPKGADVRTQIERLGYSIDQVKYLIMSHLHTDHASAIEHFPRATILVGRGEWEAARSFLGFLNGYNRRQFTFPYDYQEVPQEPMESIHPFTHGYDLFDDGTVVIVPTPGHTVGHQSVLLRLRTRTVLLAVDAAYTERSYRELVVPGILHFRGRLVTTTLEKVKLFSELHPDALIITGHDSEQWPTLKKAPDHYA
jgi:glyoxylase-like metal-dependent hydrolase (beta-lactamase superfamily II)